MSWREVGQSCQKIALNNFFTTKIKLTFAFSSQWLPLVQTLMIGLWCTQQSWWRLKNCFRDECGSAHRGRCASLDPVDGIKLLEYLRHVNFTGQTLYWNCFIEQSQECYGRHYKLFYTNVFKIDIIYIIFWTLNMIFFSKLANMLN